MSFISILKTIGQVATGIEQIAVPIATAVMPQYAPKIAQADSLFQGLQTAIATVEASNPVDGQGAIKSAAVVSDFQASLSVAQEALALDGKMLTYDSTALQTAINAQVTAYNAMAAVKASFKVIALPPTPAS